MKELSASLNGTTVIVSFDQMTLSGDHLLDRVCGLLPVLELLAAADSALDSMNEKERACVARQYAQLNLSIEIQLHQVLRQAERLLDLSDGTISPERAGSLAPPYEIDE